MFLFISNSRYIRGNVVSQHAARLIESMLTKTMARSSEFEHEDELQEADKSDMDDDFAPFTLNAEAARQFFASTPWDHEAADEPPE